MRTSQIIASYNSDYRNADLGYEEYRAHAPISRGAGYRDGFKNGYEDGYKNRPMRSDVYGLHDNYDPDRVPRNDEDVSYYANWSYSDVAFDTGYRDGLSAGRSDFSQGKDYRPEKHDSHEDGARATALRSSTRNSIARGSCEDNEDAFNRKFDS